MTSSQLTQTHGPTSTNNAVIFLGRGVYDFCETTLVEGLTNSGYVVFGIRKANKIDKITPKEELSSLAKIPSTMIIFNKENMRLALTLGSSENRRIFIDGRDDPYIYLPGLLYSSLYAKRELLNVWGRLTSKVTSFSFGIESRYPTSPGTERVIDIFVGVNLSTNKCRPIYQSLVESFQRKNPKLNIVIQMTGERSYDNRSGEPISTPRYHDYLRSAKFVLSPRGAGQDCARFWEALSAGAVPLSEKISIQYPLENDIDFPAFSGSVSLAAVLAEISIDPDGVFQKFQSRLSPMLRLQSTEARVEKLIATLESTRPRSWIRTSTAVIFSIFYNLYAFVYMINQRHMRFRFI